MSFSLKRYAYNALRVIDQVANVMIAPILNRLLHTPDNARFGDPRETLSSVLGKNMRNGHCRTCRGVCKVLTLVFRQQVDHCIDAIDPASGDKAL